MHKNEWRNVSGKLIYTDLPSCSCCLLDYLFFSLLTAIVSKVLPVTCFLNQYYSERDSLA